MREIRVSLSEEDFQHLVQGHIIEPKVTSLQYDERQDITVKVALQDIGWDKIVRAVTLAMKPDLYRESAP